MAKKKPQLEDLEQAVDEAAEQMNKRLPPVNLSLGCSLFNLAISGNVDAAAGPGRFIWFHGNSSSGKSFLTLAMLAEAANNPAYDNHKLVYVDAELGAAFDLARFFGKKTAARVSRVSYPSLEAFYDGMDKMMGQGPVIVVLDSFDALLPEAVLEKIGKDAELREANKEIGGDYGMAHGKVHSLRLRTLVNKLGDTGSCLLGISQHRDNIDKANKYSPKDKVGGGRALRFWCSVEVETSLGEKIKKTVRDKERVIGHHIKVRCHKNRISGLNREVELVFLPNYGICDISTNVDWLLSEKYLEMKGGRVVSPWYDAAYYRDNLITKIEEDEKEADLKALLQESWSDLESQLASTRKPRYADE
jgi:RecA/RadA recombinase